MILRSAQGLDNRAQREGRINDLKWEEGASGPISDTTWTVTVIRM